MPLLTHFLHLNNSKPRQAESDSVWDGARNVPSVSAVCRHILEPTSYILIILNVSCWFCVILINHFVTRYFFNGFQKNDTSVSVQRSWSKGIDLAERSWFS